MYQTQTYSYKRGRSGKTTTLIEGLRHAPGTALFMAFNKSIAEDIRGKAPKAMSKHSRAWSLSLDAKLTCFQTRLRQVEKHRQVQDEPRRLS